MRDYNINEMSFRDLTILINGHLNYLIEFNNTKHNSKIELSVSVLVSLLNQISYEVTLLEYTPNKTEGQKSKLDSYILIEKLLSTFRESIDSTKAGFSFYRDKVLAVLEREGANEED